MKSLYVMAKPLQIITICLNDPTGLEATLRSAIPLWDIADHYVNDSSPEAHKHIRKMPEFSSVKWRESSPRGIYPAINENIRETKNELQLHLHSGDKITHPEIAKKAVLALLSDPNAALLYAHAELERGGHKMFTHFHNKNFKMNLLGVTTLHHQAVLFRSSIFSEIGFFSEQLKYAGDYEFFVRVANKNLKTIYFEEAFSSFDTSGRSFSLAPEVLKETALVNKQLHMNLVERIQAFLRYGYHWTRLSILTPFLKSIGFYEGLRRVFLKTQRRSD